MKVVVIAVISYIVLNLVYCAEDRSKWADPSDMVNFDHATNRMLNKKPQDDEKREEEVTPPTACDVDKECPPCDCVKPECPPCPACPPPPECVCEQAALPLLRKYTQSLLKHFQDQMPGEKREEFNVHVHLSGDQMKIFQKFVDTGNQRHIHDVHQILDSMIDRVAASRLGRLEKLAQSIEYKIGMSLDRLTQIFSLAALASIVLLIEVRLQIAWRRRVSQLIVLMFVISIPWTWYDLYKEAEIHQEAKMSRVRPEDCKPGFGGYWKAVMSTLTLQEDKCMQYYDSLMVDPMVKVPPTKAIAVTFVRFFVAPLKDVGTAMSEFIRALLVDLPLTLYPVAMAMVCLFMFLILLFWNRYSVRLPFYLLTIEPSANVAVTDGSVHQAVAEANQQTLTQLEQLRAKLDTTQLQLTDKLQHLEKVQQLAIEHSQSFGPPSPADSPTIQRQAPASSSHSPSIPSQTRPSATQTVGPTVAARKTGDKDNTDHSKSVSAVSKDKVAKVEVKLDQASDSCARGGEGDLGATPSCSSVGGVVDTLLPDGVIEARSST